MPDSDLVRFLDAQNQMHTASLSSKPFHWMWFTFPQPKGLGTSYNACYFGIDSLQQAGRYLSHPVLGKRLVAVSTALLAISGKTAPDIMGGPDALKLHSCMTLFAALANTDPVFGQVLDKYFEGKADVLTLSLLEKTA